MLISASRPAEVVLSGASLLEMRLGDMFGLPIIALTQSFRDDLDCFTTWVVRCRREERYAVSRAAAS